MQNSLSTDFLNIFGWRLISTAVLSNSDLRSWMCVLVLFSLSWQDVGDVLTAMTGCWCCSHCHDRTHGRSALAHSFREHSPSWWGSHGETEMSFRQGRLSPKACSQKPTLVSWTHLWNAPQPPKTAGTKCLSTWTWEGLLTFKVYTRFLRSNWTLQ